MQNTKQTDPTLTPLDYHCKVCRKPGVAYLDPACPLTQLEAWRSALCCNRCGTFRDGYMRAKESAARACVLLQQARASCVGKVLKEAESKLRTTLTSATQRAARLVCNHYRVENTWSADFVEGLMDKPYGIERSFRAYHSGIKMISRQAPILPPLPTQAEMITA